MADDVSEEEKRRRYQLLEELQEEVSQEIMQRWLGRTVEILVEEQRKGRWYGRTPQGRLVFFDDDGQDYKGRLVQVRVSVAGAWSMSGSLAGEAQSAPDVIPLTLA